MEQEYNKEEFAKYFKPTYLYIKQHRVTGLKYFGKTTQDPLKYPGSGVKWKSHIQYYGYDQVDTIWYQLFNDIDECRNYALKFSLDNNIVESNEWANLIVEDGLWVKPQTRQLMREAKLGKPGHRKGAKHTEEANEKNRLAHLGKTHSDETKTKMSSSQTGRTHGDETKERIRSTLTGVKHSEERIEKMRQSKIGKTFSKVTCDICGKDVVPHFMERHVKNSHGVFIS